MPGPADIAEKNWTGLNRYETEAFLDWRELLMYQRSWLELYACQGFHLEGTANERMTRIVNGLTKHYGFDRNSEDIRYWTLHMGVDEEHMKVGPLAVGRYAVTDPQQAQVRAVQRTLDQFWLAFGNQASFFVDKDPFTPGGVTESKEGFLMEMVDLSRVIYDGIPKIPVLPDVHVLRFFQSREGHP